jgi:hypothetical protein
MRRETWGLLGVLLASLLFLGWSQAAHALSYQGRFGCAVSTTFYEGKWCYGVGAGPYNSGNEACAAGGVGRTMSGVVQTYNAVLHSYYCLNSLGAQITTTARQSVVCKQGTVVNGSLDNATGMCTGAASCPSGETADASGVCVVPSACPAAGTNYSTGYYDIGTADLGRPGVGCVGGCEMSYSGTGAVKRTSVNGVFHYWTQGTYDYTHQTCSGGSAPVTSNSAPPESTCNPATQDTGQVNGVTVCLPKSKETTTQTTQTTDPATGDVTTTTTMTKPDGEQSTVTTVRHTDGTTGAVTTTGSGITTPNSFCQKNPSDPSCVANSEKASDDICLKHPDTIACKELGAPTPFEAPPVESVDDPVVVEAQDDPIEWHQVFLPEGGVCPFQDVPLAVMGQTIQIPLAQLCPYLDAIKGLVIGLATIVSIRLFTLAPW